MTYRFFVWLSTASLAAGMWLVFLAGAGAAMASPGTDSASNASSSNSGASNSAESKPTDVKSKDSKPADAKSNDAKSADAKSEDSTDGKIDDKPSPGGTSSIAPVGTAKHEPATKAIDAKDAEVPSIDEKATDVPSDDQAELPTGEEPLVGEEPHVGDTRESDVEHDHGSGHQNGSVATVRSEVEAAPPAAGNLVPGSADTVKRPAADPVQTEPEPTAVAAEGSTNNTSQGRLDQVSETQAAAPAAKLLAIAAPPINSATVTNPPTVLDLVGTIFFDVYNIAFQLVAGPPRLPPGSTVTVRTSTLELRPGYSVPADWYVPENADPDRFIYFQHGFLFNARPYSYTIADLAESTHSIVVAPSITSNFFATDGMWLAGKPMQRAVADLFAGDRESLTASASSALGYDVTLPQRVVLFGHSYGAQTVVGAASYMDQATIDNVAGIVLLDGVSEDLKFSSLGGVPATLPIYNLAAPGILITNFGALSTALANTRPGEFNGLQLVGGTHIDAVQGNQLIPLISPFVLGPTLPENIAAAKTVIAGWANDLFAGTHGGIYAAPGTSVSIPTNAGAATAISLPAPSVPMGLFDQLVYAIGSAAIARFYNFEATAGPLALF